MKIKTYGENVLGSQNSKHKGPEAGTLLEVQPGGQYGQRRRNRKMVARGERKVTVLEGAAEGLWPHSD